MHWDRYAPRREGDYRWEDQWGNEFRSASRWRERDDAARADRDEDNREHDEIRRWRERERRYLMARGEEERRFDKRYRDDRRGDDHPHDDRRYQYAAYGSGYGGCGRRDDRDHDRGFLDKARDEMRSWFVDDRASRRREWDHVREREHDREDDARSAYDEDSELADEVRRRLRRADINADGIDVRVRDNEAILDGVVNRRRDRDEANECARAVRGIVFVRNRLQVRSRADRAAIGMGYDERRRRLNEPRDWRD